MYKPNNKFFTKGVFGWKEIEGKEGESLEGERILCLNSKIGGEGFGGEGFGYDLIDTSCYVFNLSKVGKI